MVELTKGDIGLGLLMAFLMGACWMLILTRVIQMPVKPKAKGPKSKEGWKPCVTDNGMEVQISWTSHPSWRPEEIAKLRESKNWGAE